MPTCLIFQVARTLLHLIWIISGITMEREKHLELLECNFANMLSNLESGQHVNSLGSGPLRLNKTF